eukprot:2838905-Rhodomonas_salina.1
MHAVRPVYPCLLSPMHTVRPVRYILCKIVHAVRYILCKTVRAARYVLCTQDAFRYLLCTQYALSGISYAVRAEASCFAVVLLAMSSTDLAHFPKGLGQSTAHVPRQELPPLERHAPGSAYASLLRDVCIGLRAGYAMRGTERACGAGQPKSHFVYKCRVAAQGAKESYATEVEECVMSFLGAEEHVAKLTAVMSVIQSGRSKAFVGGHAQMFKGLFKAFGRRVLEAFRAFMEKTILELQ